MTPEVLTTSLRDVTPCRWVHYQPSGVNCNKYFQYMQKKKIAGSFETPVPTYQAIPCHSNSVAVVK